MYFVVGGNSNEESCGGPGSPKTALASREKEAWGLTVLG